MGVVDFEGELEEDVLVAEGGFLEAVDEVWGVRFGGVEGGKGGGREGGTNLSVVNLFSL